MFFSKFVVSLALVAIVAAQHEHGHQATSYASSNSYNNHVSHEYNQHQAGPALIKAAPIAYHHATAPAPIEYHHAAPIAHHVPIHHTQIAHHAPIHHAPIVHHAPIHHAPLVQQAVHAAPVLLKSVHHEEEHYAPPKYQFKYGVEDKHTHDIKSQEESRDGDVVKGYYQLLQPDGRTRTVHYTADKHNGFQAHVEYSGHAGHPEQQVQHKAIVAAPVHKVVAAPILHKAVVTAPVYQTAPHYKVPAYPHF